MNNDRILIFFPVWGRGGPMWVFISADSSSTLLLCALATIVMHFRY